MHSVSITPVNRRIISFVPEGHSSRVRWLSIGALALLVTASAIFELGRKPAADQVTSTGGGAGLGLLGTPREAKPLAMLFCDPLDASEPGALIGGSLSPCSPMPPDCGADSLLCPRGEKSEGQFEATVNEELLSEGSSSADDPRAEPRADRSGPTTRTPRKKGARVRTPAEPPPPVGGVETTLAVLKALAATRPITAPRREFMDLTPAARPKAARTGLADQTLAMDYKTRKRLIEKAGDMPAPVTDALASGGVPIYRPENTQGDVAVVVSPSWPVGLSVKGTFH